jgi:hypothetical protein
MSLRQGEDRPNTWRRGALGQGRFANRPDPEGTPCQPAPQMLLGSVNAAKSACATDLGIQWIANNLLPQIA